MINKVHVIVLLLMYYYYYKVAMYCSTISGNYNVIVIWITNSCIYKHGFVWTRNSYK